MNRTRFRRVALAPVFVAGLGWAYFATDGAEPPVPPVKAIVSEEGQLVVFDRRTFQFRELSKRLPLQDPWPASDELTKAFERYGLNQNAPREPNALVPVQIAEGVYLVGQDRNSNLTYMIDGGKEGVAIIDPSFESEFERTIDNVEKCGRPRKDIRWVLNTHCHIDHSMADKKFRDIGAEIIIHEADADAIEKGTRLTAYYAANPPVTAFPRCKVDRRLSDGEELQLGDKTLHVIHTPGHTPGSVCFLLQVNGKNLLFSGDTVFYDFRLPWQNLYADNQQYLSSLEKLDRFSLGSAPFQWDVLLPGHGTMALDKAYLDVKKAKQVLGLDVAAKLDPIGFPYSRPMYRAQMYGRPATAWH